MIKRNPCISFLGLFKKRSRPSLKKNKPRQEPVFVSFLALLRLTRRFISGEPGLFRMIDERLFTRLNPSPMLENLLAFVTTCEWLVLKANKATQKKWFFLNRSVNNRISSGKTGKNQYLSSQSAPLSLKGGNKSGRLVCPPLG